jgi:hypothetical protein
MPRVVRWGLQELNARWLNAPPPRYNVGFAFDCPAHSEHRLTVRFTNPYDGEEPIGGNGLLVMMIANGGLASVTLTSVSGGHVLNFGDCGEYCIVDGKVEQLP